MTLAGFDFPVKRNSTRQQIRDHAEEQGAAYHGVREQQKRRAAEAFNVSHMGVMIAMSH